MAGAARDHAAGPRSAAVAPRPAGRGSSSTRPTTPRTPGRWPTSATCATTSTRSAGSTSTTRSSTAPPTGLWKGDPSMVVHPEVGKWLIALGEKAFGMDPFGWRVMSAVAGALMVLVLCRLVLRLTGSLLLGCVAGLLLTLDGLHFVLSRLALLDIFLALFLLCGVACVVNDRYWMRARMARLVDERYDARGRPRRLGAGARPAAAPVAAARRRSRSAWRWAPSGRRCSRWRRSACSPGCGARGRAARSASGGRCCARRWSTASRRSCTWCWSPWRSTWPRGAAGWCTPAPTRTPCRRRSTPGSWPRPPAWTARPPTCSARASGPPPPSRTPRGSARSSSRCGRSGTTTRTSTPSTPTS